MELAIWVESREDGKLVAMSQVAKIERKCCRQMAQAQGVSKSTVSTIWRSHNLKPHRVKSFKPSRDARFLEKLTDVVGLYLNPPDQALVLVERWFGELTAKAVRRGSFASVA